MTTCRFSETSTLRWGETVWENHECCFISSSDRSSSRRTVIASGNRVLVGADGAVVEVTSYRAFWPLAQRSAFQICHI